MADANRMHRRSSNAHDQDLVQFKRAKLGNSQQISETMAADSEIYDLLILVDATFSMSNYLTSLQSSLPKIIPLSALTDSFSRIGLLAYRDYCDAKLLEWSGWSSSTTNGDAEDLNRPRVDLLSFAKTLEPDGGGDYPEATKTGLAKAYQEMREEAKTIILLYTDAPPHTTANGAACGNWGQEQKALGKPESYGGFGPSFMDWVHASRTMAGKEGKKRAQVFSILEPSMMRFDGDNYTFLSTVTGGACFYLKNSRPHDISKVTVDLLLAWMGAEKAGTTMTDIAAKLSIFPRTNGIEDVKKEATKGSKKAAKTDELNVDAAIMREFLPKRKTPIQDFARRYKTDGKYKRLVVEEIRKIINFDVCAISLNPVFGSLWRAVCNDRENPNREELISSFGLQVDRITSADEKERMKNWLAESYDYSAEVQEAIESIPENQRYPCVYLDPTLAFTKTKDAYGEDDEARRAITDFRRDELLEIGRSCDYRILRRLGRVLTRLSYVNARDEVPSHIQNANEGTAVRIPLALAAQEFGRKFWKILLHIIVPGTMLSARPAALLAALTIRLGIQPLFKAAETEMLLWRDKWNNLEVPETWNTSCLSLLLDADKAYQGYQRNINQGAGDSKVKGLLKKSDRELFNRLVSYMLLERNLATTLYAKVGWTPDKTMMPIGPLVTCYSCHYPRSVTMMSARGKCGICASPDPENPKERQTWIDTGVSKEDKDSTNAMWVECGIRTCRAQYIVYHPEALNVRPKCFYCREQSSIPNEKLRSDDPAPWLECEQCLSRVIFPKEYRTDTSPYKCVACINGRTSIVSVDTTAKKLSAENGTAWLLDNKDYKLQDPLGGRTLFHQISGAGIENFCSQVIVFPNRPSQVLKLNGKPLQNTADVIQQLQTWVFGRRTESGTCSLCFSDKRKTDLHPACSRRSCEQRICRDCLSAWYGLNAAGRIINVAALSCPFCRRTPTAKTLHGYGMGIHAVGDLRAAVENAGQWVYAWCAECSKAKQYLERVCARGAPPEVEGWVCEQCVDERDAAARRAVEALRLEEERLAQEGRRMDYERRRELQLAIERARAEHSKQADKFKECPQCKVMTEKSYGCGHMSCPCGAHWCWFCGGNFKPTEIYPHMADVHDGWFEGDDDDDYNDDYED